jgi:hypothetical protein
MSIREEWERYVGGLSVEESRPIAEFVDREIRSPHAWEGGRLPEVYWPQTRRSLSIGSD